MTRYNPRQMTRDRLEDMPPRTLQDIALVHRHEAKPSMIDRWFGNWPSEAQRTSLRIALDAEAILMKRADNADWRRY